MTEERAPYHIGQEPAEAPESTHEHQKTLRSYFIEQEPAPEHEIAHEHLFRVVFGNKTIVRFCERCGRTWLVTELRDLLHNNRFVYTWSEVLEEAEAHKKLMEANEPMPRACVADKFYKCGWKKQRKSLFPRNLFEKKEDGGVV